jgi:hypothetical protein
MSTPVLAAGSVFPPQLDRLERGARTAAAVGLLAALVGLFLDPDQFFRSWLFAFLFWVGIAIGCLSISMIHHLTGGMWGLVIRRLLEAGTRTFAVLAVLFLPLLFGMKRIYEWARPEAASDPILSQKALYLNVPFFAGRAAFYFAAWLFLAHFLGKWSLAQDAGEDERLSRRQRGLSGVGLLVMGFTITFASVDWAMSLSPHWFSTVYGVLFMVGQALSALALVIVIVAWIGNAPPLAGVVRKEQIHDLGKLMLAFVMLWAYINLSQFLIMWSGNLPEEIPWYMTRLAGGWQWLGLLLVIGHFVLPFLMLLSRDLKRSSALLGRVAGLVLLARVLDLFWLVAPDLAGHGAGVHVPLHIHWLDVMVPVGVGGVWLWVFTRELKGRPLLPVGDPEIRERLEGRA